MIAFNILTFYWVIWSFFTKKKVEVNCVIILFYYLGDKHSMNLTQITGVTKIFVIISRICVVCPIERCVTNLHEKANPTWQPSWIRSTRLQAFRFGTSINTFRREVFVFLSHILLPIQVGFCLVKSQIVACSQMFFYN